MDWVSKVSIPESLSDSLVARASSSSSCALDVESRFQASSHCQVQIGTLIPFQVLTTLHFPLVEVQC